MNKTETAGIIPATPEQYTRPAMDVIDIQPEGGICNPSNNWDGSAEFDEDNWDYPI